MFMKTILLTIPFCLLLSAGHGQFYNDGDITNDGGLMSDWQTQWFNTSNGIFTGNNSGIFEHRGPSSQTFVNDGVFNALSGHTDQFLGPLGTTGPQEIAGSVRPYFYNLDLNNGATAPVHITNTDGVNVRGTAAFSNGITTTVRTAHQAGALRFETGAVYTGGNTDAQHVNGYVSKSGSEAFTFPVGSGTDLRTLSIGAPALASEISAAWIAGDPGSIPDPSDGGTHSIAAIATPIVSVSTLGYWDYMVLSGNDDGLAISVSIPDLSAFAIAADLRLIGWDGTQWIDLSGGATATGNSENSILNGTIPAGSTITAIGIGSISAVLPVQFSSFTVSSRNCEADLKWSTATELNNAFFTVERSTDGVSFSSLGQVTGAGNSTTVRSYTYTDKDPIPGNNFYRIRQTDFDGRSKTTEIQRLQTDCGKEVAIKVYPTISSSVVTVILPETFRNAKVLLFDISGRNVPVYITKSSLKYEIPIHSVPSGKYILQVSKDREIQTFKIVRP
jgi:hypothetical protein